MRAAPGDPGGDPREQEQNARPSRTSSERVRRPVVPTRTRIEDPFFLGRECGRHAASVPCPRGQGTTIAARPAVRSGDGPLPAGLRGPSSRLELELRRRNGFLKVFGRSGDLLSALRHEELVRDAAAAWKRSRSVAAVRRCDGASRRRVRATPAPRPPALRGALARAGAESALRRCRRAGAAPGSVGGGGEAWAAPGSFARLPLLAFSDSSVTTSALAPDALSFWRRSRSFCATSPSDWPEASSR